MDSSIINLEDSNVLNITEDVIVTEERYKSYGKFSLTKEQAVIELTNLLYDEYKDNIKHLASHVDTFQGILAGTTDDLSKFVDELVFPIVGYKKTEYFHDADFNVDEEVEKEKDVKFTMFASFLNQLNTLMKSREPYTATESRLNRLFTPFEDDGDTTKASRTTDAYRQVGDAPAHSHPFRLLEDDKTRPVGYLCKSKESSKFVEFDWSVYLKDLESVSKGDTVAILLNDFYFQSKKPITSIAGTVEKIQQRVLFIKTKLGDTLKYDLNDPQSNMYVYPVKSKNYRFSKLDLLKENIIFKNCNINAIVPKTMTEVLFVVIHHSKKEITGFEDIHKVLASLNVYNLHLHKTTEGALRAMFAKELPRLVLSANRKVSQAVSPMISPYLEDSALQVSNGIADCDVQRFEVLKRSSSEAEQLYLLNKILDFFKQYAISDTDALDQQRRKIITDHVRPATQDTCAERPVKIAKTYTKLEDLISDNGKMTYYDTEHDKTEYTENVTGLRERLVNDASMSPREIEFEVQTVQKGKRKVRDGDHCILLPSTLYVRKHVDNTHMWVKVRKFPYPICADNINEHLDTSPTTCAYDVYSNVCKTIENVKKNILYQKASQKADILKHLVEFAKQHAAMINKVKDDILFLERRQEINATRTAHIAMEKVESADMDDFFADGDNTLATATPNANFEEKDRYAPLAEDKPYTFTNVTTTSPANEIMDMFVTFMDIDIRDKDKNYILAMVNKRTPSVEHVQEKLDKEKRKLDKGVDKKLYINNDQYRAKVDKLVKDKLEGLQEKFVADLYYDSAVNTIALLSLIIMMRYPKLLIQNVYPSCVRFLTYQGYPINSKDATRSINKYMCCIIKGLTSGADPRYDKIQGNRIDDLNNDVIKTVDELMTNDANIKLKVEANQALLKQSVASGKEDYGKRSTTFDGFLPNVFNDENFKTNNSVAARLQTLGKMVKDAKHLKVSISKLPQLLNACCLEKVADVKSYYDFFGNELPKTSKRNELKAPQNKVHIPPVKIPAVATDMFNVPISFGNPGIAYVHSIPIAEADKISTFVQNNPLFVKDDVLNEASSRYDDESYWDDVVYTKSVATYDSLLDIIKQLLDDAQLPKLELFKHICVLMRNVKDIDAVRSVMYNYVNVGLPRYIHRIYNGKYDETSWEINFANNKDIVVAHFSAILKDALRGFKESIYFEDDATKNTSLMTYIFIKILYNLIMQFSSAYQIYNTMPDQELKKLILSAPEDVKGRLSIMARLVHDCIVGLVDKLIANDVDASHIRKKVEELREQKKQDLIALYHFDDEERQLQMTLKKIGVDSWFDVGAQEEKENDVYIDLLQPNANIISLTEARNVAEENENYRLGDYPGENADDNGDEAFEDYPSQFIFSADRDV